MKNEIESKDVDEQVTSPAFHAASGSPSFGVWDEESEKLKIKAELQFLKTLHISDRVAVTFTSKMDARCKMVKCEPYTEIGEIVTLELHRGRGHITIHFDGEDKPTGPFKPSEVRLILDNAESTRSAGAAGGQ